MKKYILEIKDECRNNLCRYTIQAFSIIPEIEKPLILDIGCGTGVTLLSLAKKFDGTIYGVDPDMESINRLKKKVSELKLNERIKIFNDSIFNTDLFQFKFNIVLAEGLLNVIGFEKGLPLLISYVKKGGFIIIHDELKDDTEKRTIFESYKLKLLGSFTLNQDVWWNEYYDCLEKKIKNIYNGNQFENELKEIEGYKKNPLNYKSIYYILHN
jgi:cyclopropane fatty-acyl-phospholipid synthase-like methyltransferase